MYKIVDPPRKNNMKSIRVCILLPALLSFTGISCTQEKPPKADTIFVRFQDGGRGEGVLETAIATYENKAGQKVELIAAVHIADTAYYKRLEELFAGYESVQGAKVDPERVRFWETFGSLKWGIMCMSMYNVFNTGLDRSVERAAIGRRSSETEIDLLRILTQET